MRSMMASLRLRVLRALVLFASMGVSGAASAKDYKSAEYITQRRFGFGAYEARIRAAQGPGVITTFFLWRPGSEQPSVPWEEIDFELGIKANDYQTQVMTPGTSPPLYRKEHAVSHRLPTWAWERYYTYRIEWTPDYIAFYVDGQEVRRVTDKVEFAALFNTDANGDTPENERMEVRLGAWPGLSNIWGWSGTFDGRSVPTAVYVDYLKVWDYTPAQTNKFATLLLNDQFDQLRTDWWYFAEWTFEFSASDYVRQNVGIKQGNLVASLTTSAQQGYLPEPPPVAPWPDPVSAEAFAIEAENYHRYYDTTIGNSGNQACSTTDVDAELTTDTQGGSCNVGWTADGEWLEYRISLLEGGWYDVILRYASLNTKNSLHIEVDGVDVSGPIVGPGRGSKNYSDAIVPEVHLGAGAHVVRLVFDKGQFNVNFLDFLRIEADDPELCAGGCDDGNECTTDVCDPLLGCSALDNTLPCTDDGDTCTTDVCAAGACTHPDIPACGVDASPCDAFCDNPTPFSGNYSSGNLGVAATCHETTSSLNGGVCGNFSNARKLSVNGVLLSCSSTWTLPPQVNGGYCVQTTAGDFPWAYFVTW